MRVGSKKGLGINLSIFWVKMVRKAELNRKIQRNMKELVAGEMETASN